MNNKRFLAYNILFAFISPLFALINAIRSGDKKIIKWSIIIFCTLFASTFTLTSFLGDGIRHWNRVYNYYTGISFNQFINDLVDILFFVANPNTNDDVYIHVLSYIVGGVLGFPGLFFIAVGFIYGYFFAGSLVKMFDTFPSYRKHYGMFVIAVYFLLILNFQSMNTVRTWTGFWILFYGVISYYQTGNKNYLYLVFLPPLFHIGYFIMTLPVWFYLYFNINKRLVLMIFVLSFGFNFISPQFAIEQLSQFEVGAEKVFSYEVEEEEGILESVNKRLNWNQRWYVTYRQADIAPIGVYGIAILYVLSGAYYRRMNKLEQSLFSMGLLMKSLSNTTWFLYALSRRSDTIAVLFLLSSIYIYWQRNIIQNSNHKEKYYVRIGTNIFSLIFIPVFIFYISNIMEYTSFFAFFAPFMVWINEDLRYSIREVLGMPFGI